MSGVIIYWAKFMTSRTLNDAQLKSAIEFEYLSQNHGKGCKTTIASKYASYIIGDKYICITIINR